MNARPSVLVLLDHGRGPATGSDWNVDPESFPYGYGHGSPYLDLQASTSAKEPLPIRAFRRGLAFALGFDIVHAFRNRRLIKAVDAVITHTEHEHLAVALLIRLRIVPPVPIVGQSIWLWDSWRRFGPLRRALYLWLLNTTAVHTVHSPSNAVLGSRVLNTSVRLLPYGAHVPSKAEMLLNMTSPPQNQPQSPTVIRVIAPGSDRHRDWSTLVNAAKIDPTLRVTIASRRLRPRLEARRCPDRVKVVSLGSSREVRRLLRLGAVIAIPLKPNLHASGLTVLFESLSSRRPVAVTRTGGLDVYGAQYAEWAHPGDAASLARAIHRAAELNTDVAQLDQAWESVCERGLTMSDYGLRHVLAVWLALGRPVDPGGISAMTPIAEVVRNEAERLQHREDE